MRAGTDNDGPPEDGNTAAVRRLPPAAQRGPTAIVKVDTRPAAGDRLADLGPLDDSEKTSDRISKSRSWVYQAVKRGDFPRPIYVGRQAYWPRRWTDEWIAAQVAAQLEPAANDGTGAP